MRIAIPLTGTRGDVHPIVGLGVELQRRGHQVLLGAPPNLVDFVTAAGLPAQPCGPDVQQLYSSEEGQRALAAGNTLRLMQLVGKQMAEYAERMNREVIEVCAKAELIVASTVTEDRASSIAEAMGVPLVSLHYYPCRMNSAYPFPGLLPAQWNPPAPVNRATWLLAENLRRVVFLRYLNQLRGMLGLPKSYASPAAALARARVPEIQIYDPALVPGLAEQWDSRRPFTGFLTLDEATRTAVGELSGSHDELLAWIESGDPPVFFGFGSMPIRDAAAVFAMVERVSARLGIRALVHAGWSDLDVASTVTADRIKLVRTDFAYDRIFPHCAAAVHHGGIGTLFESLRAGLPTVVCSVSFEQPMWGGQVEKLGVGAHLPFTTLTAERLETALRPLLDADSRRRVRAFARTLRTSGTAEHAADLIEAAVR
ncbi:glycosyltransferase [Nocardia yunnanensis]|uniref:Glycosyltransferase n=1 Tax=Nocardia yunnanensis TaxID=2382165 RepID=A0A386ZB40_9NOCA|nr:glycosyltransferase [Nocardia yunnanensis]AYF73835.1 glycosyltransferase [Nocardia yunnanensis]